MTKKEFLAKLREGLTGLPQDDLENRLLFYGEMIDDLVEDGLTEEQAVAEIGDVKDVVDQTVAEIPFAKLVKERIKIKKRMGWLGVLLIVLGSPIWLSLFIALFAVIISLYVAIWSVVISLWAVDLALVACALGGLISAVLTAFLGTFPQCLLSLSLAFLSVGLATLFYFVCAKITKGTLLLAKKLFVGIKRCFMKKEI